MSNEQFPYLNDYHRKLNERLARRLSQQPRRSLQEAIEQYNRLNRGHTAKPPHRKLARERGEE